LRSHLQTVYELSPSPDAMGRVCEQFCCCVRSCASSPACGNLRHPRTDPSARADFTLAPHTPGYTGSLSCALCGNRAPVWPPPSRATRATCPMLLVLQESLQFFSNIRDGLAQALTHRESQSIVTVCFQNTLMTCTDSLHAPFGM